jgi:hypothetical protein
MIKYIIIYLFLYIRTILSDLYLVDNISQCQSNSDCVVDTSSNLLSNLLF